MCPILEWEIDRPINEAAQAVPEQAEQADAYEEGTDDESDDGDEDEDKDDDDDFLPVDNEGDIAEEPVPFGVINDDESLSDSSSNSKNNSKHWNY